MVVLPTTEIIEPYFIKETRKGLLLSWFEVRKKETDLCFLLKYNSVFNSLKNGSGLVKL